MCVSEDFSRVLVVTVVCAIAVVCLVAYELFLFEWKDWHNDGFPPGVLGYTGGAVLWAFSTLWSLSRVFYGVLEIFSKTFCEFSVEKKTRVVKYFMQITWGTVMSVTLTVVHLFFKVMFALTVQQIWSVLHIGYGLTPMSLLCT